VDLTSFAGYTITNSEFVTDTSTPAGTWNILFGDISLVHPDGTVVQVFNRGSFSFGSYFPNGSGVTNQSSFVETSTVASDASNPSLTTTYYVSDQIGSSRMDIAYGSWPTWWGAFDPYGAEIDTNVTPNNFKFSGKERDTQSGESGLDNFNARSYSSNLVGKFMQPDPAGQMSANPWNPLSWYMYGYVLSNPLRLVDPTGLESGEGPANNWDGAGRDTITAAFKDGTADENATVIVAASDGCPVTQTAIATPKPQNKPTSVAKPRPVDRPGCPAVPPHPAGADVDANIGTAQFSNAINWLNPATHDVAVNLWFTHLEAPGQAWDYKSQGGMQYDDFGNFNYGAAGAAAGFPLSELQTVAGGLSAVLGTGNQQTYGPFYKSPYYAHAPIKSSQISAGYAYFKNGCYK